MAETRSEASQNLLWLDWVQRLQGIAQSGLTFTEGVYDRERYHKIQELVSEIMATYSNMQPTHVLNLFQNEKGYATPKVDARGAIFQDDRVLLVRERDDQKWTLPGGWIDVGESPSQAVEREVFEESGYQSKAVKLAALYDRNKHSHTPGLFHSYKLFFLCELIGGAPQPSIETDAIDFFPVQALPELSLSRVIPSQIARLYDHWQHPDWPTDFD